MFRPTLAIIRFFIRKICMLSECLYKACSGVSMLRSHHRWFWVEHGL